MELSLAYRELEVDEGCQQLQSNPSPHRELRNSQKNSNL